MSTIDPGRRGRTLPGPRAREVPCPRDRESPSTGPWAAANSTPAARDGELVRRLRAAGAVILGKTNLPELAIMGDTEGPSFGITRNPWDTDRSPGGSSGGSAAAVAAGGTADPGPVQDHGFMYGRSALDPDGHHFEFFWMDAAAAQQSAASFEQA